MSGFAGSNENLGGGPVLDRGGMVYVSSSSTRDNLASNLKNFYRVVPNNVAQARLAVGTLLKNGVIKAGDQAMVVDDAEAYAANQADDVQKLLDRREHQGRPRVAAGVDFGCDRELLGAREQGGRHQGEHRLRADPGRVGLTALRAAAEERRLQG